jgi:pimeloyl-ACP methyl ester carboxylesterase
MVYESHETVKRPATFVLVHGAWHGAWCWELLTPVLNRAGHRTVAPDLPVDDGSCTFEDYAAHVTGALEHADDPLVLVGHSLGSMVIPLVAAQQRIHQLVFLCGVVPRLAGNPWDDGPLMEEPGAYASLVEHPDGSTSWPSLDAARHAFYDECSSDVAAWAYERLRPQNSSSLWTSPYPLHTWPAVPRSSIIGTRDRAITPAWARYAAERRLNVQPIELPSDHSPMLSCPELLAETLVSLLAE